MYEILQLYTSGFWVWLGITPGLWLIGAIIVNTIKAVLGWSDD